MTCYQPKYTERNRDFFVETVPAFRAKTNGHEYLTAPIKNSAQFNLLELIDAADTTEVLLSVKITKIYFNITKRIEAKVIKTSGAIDLAPCDVLYPDTQETIVVYDQPMDLAFSSDVLALHSRNDINWSDLSGLLSLKIFGKTNPETGEIFISIGILNVLSEQQEIIFTITGYDLSVETIDSGRRPVIVTVDPPARLDKAISIVAVAETPSDAPIPLLVELQRMLKDDLVSIGGLSTSFKIINKGGHLSKVSLYNKPITLTLQESHNFHIEKLMDLWIALSDDIVSYKLCFYIAEHNLHKPSEVLNVWKIVHPYPDTYEGREINNFQSVRTTSITLGGNLTHFSNPPEEISKLFSTTEV